jgi:hypothetical protein
LESIVGGYDILAQPALHGGIPFFQRAQTGPDHLTGRGVGSRVYQPVNILTLFAGQTDSSLYTESGRHDR